MADVTISSLPLGTPSRNALLPYSQGGQTLAVAPSGIVAASPGSVIQIAYGTWNTVQTNNSQSVYVDTGLQATILPKTTSSTILVNISIPCYSSTGSGDVYMDFTLTRNDTVIQYLGASGVAGSNTVTYNTFNKPYVDTLGVLGSFTYKLRVKGNSGTNQTCPGNTQAVMTITEITG
jgi:hypothetical protein